MRNLAKVLCISIAPLLFVAGDASAGIINAKTNTPVKINTAGRVDTTTCLSIDSVNGKPNISKYPDHGVLTLGYENAIFHSITGTSPCNGKIYKANVLYYTSSKGYKGVDTVDLWRTRYVGRMEQTEKVTIQLNVQ